MSELPEFSNVVQFLSEQAIRQPNEPAVRAPRAGGQGGAIDYEAATFIELEDQASATGQLFLSQGIRRGTRVLLMVKPGMDLIRIVFALFKIGAVPIVIDPGMGLKGFLRCVRHAEPEALVGIPLAVWISRLFRPSFKTVQAKVAVTKGFARRIQAAAFQEQLPTVDSASDELAAILFTSGSTGPAKGVCYTHGMFAAQVAAIRGQYGIEPGEVDLPMLPVFALFNPALGMCTIVPEMNPSRPATVDPEMIVRAIQQNEVTNSFGSPALWTKIERYCREESITLPSIRRILMAGAPVSPLLMERMAVLTPNGMIHTPYGATEALPVSSIASCEVLSETAAKTLEGQGTCVGQALPGVQIRVIEPVDGPIKSIELVVDLPKHQTGEIIVQGPSVTRHYDNLPKHDADSKIADADAYWHRMGDMGWLDDSGRLWFCGRKAERVLTAEGPLYTDCCEAIFNQHPKVYRSALIDLGSGRPGIVIEPEVEAYPKDSAAETRWIAELRERAKSSPLTQKINDFFFE
ncbi:MAG: fatty acid CoA ligase family protein, partial [Verrucomicrobiota bacterium]